ncbi:MAG: hypothetical protein O7J95_20520 [Planctomycetota bacterium]|nr:hypothetical protein [Planctomycetota bacterium]
MLHRLLRTALAAGVLVPSLAGCRGPDVLDAAGPAFAVLTLTFTS